MKVVLHIGLPKTGSTSIQSALARSRSLLKRQGVFYPRLHMHENHNLLSLPFSKNLPRTLGKLSKAEKAWERTQAQECWLRLGKQISRERPSMVILSSEYFASVSRPDDLISTVMETLPGASNIEVVAYLRRPSQHYVSLTQQKLKASAKLPVPRRIQYSEVLAPFAARCDLHLREMHPQKLVDADVVADFVAAVLPGRSGLVPSAGARKNESVSAEAMALLQEFRRHAFEGQDHVLNLETTRLIKAIRTIEAKHGADVRFTRPRLLPRLETYIDYSTSDNRELRNRFGFTFCDLNDDHVDGLEIEERHYRDVADVIGVDSEKLAILRSLVFKELTTHGLDLAWVSRKLSRWRRL